MNGTMNGMNSMGSGMMMNNGGGNSMNGGGNGMMSNSYSGGSLSAAGRGAPMGEVDDGEEAVVYQIVYGKPGSMGLDMRPHSLEYSLQSGQKGDCRALLSDPDPLKHPSLDLLPTHPLLCPLTHPLNLPSHTLSIYPHTPSLSTPPPLSIYLHPFRGSPRTLSGLRPRWFAHQTRRHHGQHQWKAPDSRCK